MKGWIEIFRTGKHTSATGKTKEWTESDLDKIVSGYTRSNHEAPLVIGHPKENAPAWGWVQKLKKEAGKLFMKANQIDPKFAEMVKDGRFKKRSISIYPDGNLRHVGFLGAKPPAVKGLSDIAFNECELDTYEFSNQFFSQGSVFKEDISDKATSSLDEDEKLAIEIASRASNTVKVYSTVDFSEDERIAEEMASVHRYDSVESKTQRTNETQTEGVEFDEDERIAEEMASAYR